MIGGLIKIGSLYFYPHIGDYLPNITFILNQLDIRLNLIKKDLKSEKIFLRVEKNRGFNNFLLSVKGNYFKIGREKFFEIDDKGKHLLFKEEWGGHMNEDDYGDTFGKTTEMLFYRKTSGDDKERLGNTFWITLA